MLKHAIEPFSLSVSAFAAEDDKDPCGKDADYGLILFQFGPL